MPRRATSRTRIAATSVPATRILDDARIPEALRTTFRGAEALSTGLVHALTETVVSAVRGAQEVGAELGTTALSAVRGSIRAAGNGQRGPASRRGRRADGRVFGAASTAEGRAPAASPPRASRLSGVS